MTRWDRCVFALFSRAAMAWLSRTQHAQFRQKTAKKAHALKKAANRSTIRLTSSNSM